MITIAPQGKPKLAIVTVATGKYYDLFFRDLEASILDKIVPNFDVKIYCFTDHQGPASPRTEFCPARHFGWPFDTLLRFHLMAEILDRLMTHDFVLYMDSDMIFQRAFDPSILNANLVAVQHPGFFRSLSEATYEIDPEASSYVPLHKRKIYVQGCFWGGKPFFIKELLLSLKDKTNRDLALGEIPIFHDESYLNWFLADRPFQALSPAHAFPEGWDLPFRPVIIHRTKNHDTARNITRKSLPAANMLRELSLQEQAEYYGRLYLRAHEKTQRLEQRLLLYSRAEEKIQCLERSPSTLRWSSVLSRLLHAFPLLQSSLSFYRKLSRRNSPAKK